MKLVDESMFGKYAQFVGEKAASRPTKFERLEHALYGLLTETGEFGDAMKRIKFYNQNFDTVNKEGKTHNDNILEELGDLCFYLQLAVNEYELTLFELMSMNMDKLNKRYKAKFSVEEAAARADKVE